VAPDNLPKSLGRNGELKTAGVSVASVGREVWIQPITAKNRVGRCVLAMPKDPKTLRELAAILLMVAEDLEPHDIHTAA